MGESATFGKRTLPAAQLALPLVELADRAVRIVDGRDPRQAVLRRQQVTSVTVADLVTDPPKHPFNSWRRSGERLELVLCRE